MCIRARPERVVERLEIIQIDEQQCTMTARSRTDGNGLLQPILQERSVGQPRELVKVGQILNAFFGFSSPGDVFGRRQGSRDCPSFIANQPVVPGDRQFLPRGIDDAVLVVLQELRFSSHQRVEDLVYFSALVRRNEIVKPGHSEQRAFALAQQLLSLIHILGKRHDGSRNGGVVGVCLLYTSRCV